MTDTAIYTELGQFPNGSGTFDVTNATEVSAARTPTGLVVMACSAVNLDSPTHHLLNSWGVTDFTDVGAIHVTDEHNSVTLSDCTRLHNETNIIQILNPGQTSVDRSATVAAITGGVRFTASSGSDLYRVHCILIFGTVCKAFSTEGDGSMAADETVDIAHGMSTEPGAGFYGYSRRDNAGSSDMRFSLGFHAYDGVIKQACCGWTSENGEDPSRSANRTFGDGTNNLVLVGSSASAGPNLGLELTAIDTTNVTYTNRFGTNTDKYVGLLLECEDVATDLAIINSPTTAGSDWNFNGLSFQSQFVAFLTNRTTVVNVAEQSGDGGCGGFAAMDEEGREHTTSWSTEDNLDLSSVNTNTNGEMSQALFSPTETGTNSHLMVNPTFTADGWDFLAADITTANSTIRKWPMLAIEQLSGASNAPLFSSHLTKMQGN